MYSPRTQNTASEGGISRFLEGHRQQPWMERHSSTGLQELHLNQDRNWHTGEYPQDENWSSGSKHAQLLRGECVHAFDHSNGSILRWVVSKEDTHRKRAHPRRKAKEGQERDVVVRRTRSVRQDTVQFNVLKYCI